MLANCLRIPMKKKSRFGQYVFNKTLQRFRNKKQKINSIEKIFQGCFYRAYCFLNDKECLHFAVKQIYIKIFLQPIDWPVLS